MQSLNVAAFCQQLDLGLAFDRVGQKGAALPYSDKLFVIQKLFNRFRFNVC